MAKPELTEWDEDLIAAPEDDYEALVRSLQWAKGFGLLFVQCTPAKGEQLMQRVQADIADKTVDVLHLEGEVVDLYETVAALPEIDKTNVLFVTGLEKSLVPYIKPGYGSEGDYYAKDTMPELLGKLNLQRERFCETFELCFVFLVPPYAMKYLVRRAADFFDWRSGIWEFMALPDEVRQATQHLLLESSYTQYLSWTPKQRRERILEIADLLAESNHLPDEISHLHFEQGNICAANQQFEGSLASYDAVLTLKPDDPQTLNHKGIALVNLGRCEEAIAIYDAVLAIKPDDHYALNNKGIALSCLGRHDEAITCYDTALVFRPGDCKALGNKGHALSCLERYAEAIACGEAALEINPDKHQTHHNKGIVLDELGRHEEAINCYDAVLAIKPDFQNALINKGIALDILGRYAEAIACYDAALAFKSDQHQALYNKGIALDKLGRYEEAIKCYDAALSIKPDKHAALINKGVALRNLGRYEEAIICYDAALLIKPDHQLAIDNKQDALQKLVE